jgi:hypothetical protein
MKNVDMSLVNDGQYPAKPYFSSNTERAIFLFMIGVNITVVSYWLGYLTWGAN